MSFLTLMLVTVLTAVAGPSPQAPAGRDACRSCHEPVAQQFDQSAHGNIAAFELRGQAPGCESCHGPGSAHVEAGGDRSKIRAFSALSTPDKNQVCLSCHRGNAAMHWAGSVHAASDVSCTDCHRIHQSRRAVSGPLPADGAPHEAAPAPKASLVKPEPELCLSCHAEERAKLSAPSHHPVREGIMTCSSCHNAHGSSLGTLRTTERLNDLCVKCHARQQGPFVFEHAPVSETCLTCHDPHGAVANHLLRQNEPFLCLQCHEMHFHSARVSLATPYSLPTGGSSNPNGVTGFMRAFNTRCTACHTKIHGSNLPSQGVSGRGKALTR